MTLGINLCMAGLVAILCAIAALVGCTRPIPTEDSVYTLYRSSALENGSSMRIHVASFDSSDGEDYNRENCAVGQNLFQSQGGVAVRFWCEKGRYRK